MDNQEEKDHDIDVLVQLAILKEKLKHLESLVTTTTKQLEALQKDRDSALLWGLAVLGTAVISMGTWIFKYVTKALT